MKGFIFDLDGTLLDSIGMWLKIDMDYMAMHGIEYKKEYSDVIKTLTFDECAYYFRDVLGVNKGVDQIKHDWKAMSQAAYIHELELKPYAFDYVKQCAQEGKCIIATSCQKELALACLKRCGLIDYLEDIITTEEIGKSKENPDIYYLCAEKIGLEPEECTVYEDVLEAASSAYHAGFNVIAVYDKMWEKDEQKLREVSHKYIISFEEMMK